ncbi:serine/threonine protein kinase [Chondromyces apiculatus DSM 436]|uniref:Serine/threonine protein kinase n=2 Tax=Chondromyces apiculatus TaxID=51 RepID=A0A017SYS4_9BACT|nr:serine/threonine protein kinase [Chondromyces apiculatus DSM 436]
MNDMEQGRVGDTLLCGTPYRVRRHIGRGGAGDVYEAEHRALAKSVVLKVLHPDLCREPRAVERLRIEAQVLARLSHPNLVEVRDLGQTVEGRSYVVMERLMGRTLREEIEARGKLPVLEAIGYLEQALAGLAAAHGAGVVHRDVKPDNLFVCAPDPSGVRRVKVLDFGAVKLSPAMWPAHGALRTAQGVLVGSPRYAAPEQVKGRAVDGRTDVYAAGLVLYTLVTGRGPFAPAQRLDDILRAHLTEEPTPPSRFAPEIPPALDRIILRALEKDPERRFPGAAAFAAELARVAAWLTEAQGRHAQGQEEQVTHGGPSAAVPMRRWVVTEPLDPHQVPADVWPGRPAREVVAPGVTASAHETELPGAASVAPAPAASVALVSAASVALVPAAPPRAVLLGLLLVVAALLGFGVVVLGLG